MDERNETIETDDTASFTVICGKAFLGRLRHRADIKGMTLEKHVIGVLHQAMEYPPYEPDIRD